MEKAEIKRKLEDLKGYIMGARDSYRDNDADAARSKAFRAKNALIEIIGLGGLPNGSDAILNPVVDTMVRFVRGEVSNMKGSIDAIDKVINFLDSSKSYQSGYYDALSFSSKHKHGLLPSSRGKIPEVPEPTPVDGSGYREVLNRIQTQTQKPKTIDQRIKNIDTLYEAFEMILEGSISVIVSDIENFFKGVKSSFEDLDDKSKDLLEEKIREIESHVKDRMKSWKEVDFSGYLKGGEHPSDPATFEGKGDLLRGENALITDAESLLTMLMDSKSRLDFLPMTQETEDKINRISNFAKSCFNILDSFSSSQYDKRSVPLTVESTILNIDNRLGRSIREKDFVKKAYEIIRSNRERGNHVADDDVGGSIPKHIDSGSRHTARSNSSTDRVVLGYLKKISSEDVSSVVGIIDGKLDELAFKEKPNDVGKMAEASRDLTKAIEKFEDSVTHSDDPDRSAKYRDESRKYMQKARKGLLDLD